MQVMHAVVMRLKWKQFATENTDENCERKEDSDNSKKSLPSVVI